MAKLDNPTALSDLNIWCLQVITATPPVGGTQPRSADPCPY